MLPGPQVWAEWGCPAPSQSGNTGEQHNPGSPHLCISACLHASHVLQGHLSPKQLHPTDTNLTSSTTLVGCKINLPFGSCPRCQGSKRPWLRQAAGSSQLLMTDTHSHSQAAAQLQCWQSLQDVQSVLLGLLMCCHQIWLQGHGNTFFPVEPSCYGDFSPIEVSLPEWA